jgi:hypothetical protein
MRPKSLCRQSREKESSDCGELVCTYCVQGEEVPYCLVERSDRRSPNDGHLGFEL